MSICFTWFIIDGLWVC